MRYLPLAGVVLAAGLGAVWFATRTSTDSENPVAREERDVPHPAPPAVSSHPPLRAPVDFPVLYVRVPRGEVDGVSIFSGGGGRRLQAGGKLVLAQPDGSQEVLFDPGPLATASEPSVSFDGERVAFTIYSYDPHPSKPDRRRPSRETLSRPTHSDIHVLDLATRSVRPLTFQDKAAGRGIFNSGPCWVAPDRILFTSTRRGYRDGEADQLHLMDPDGGNLELVGHMNLARAAWPVPLADGRVAWTTWEDMGLSSAPRLAIWSSNPDGSDARPLSGDLTSDDRDYEFAAQLAGGDLVLATRSAGGNSGALLRVPFGTGGSGGSPEPLATGRFAHPAGTPGGHLLVTRSGGPSGSGIYLLPQGRPVSDPREIVAVADTPDHDEIWPRPLVPWSALHGRDAPPVRRADQADVTGMSGVTHPALRPGTPFGLVGASSMTGRGGLDEDIYGVRILAIEPAGGTQAVSTALAGDERLRILAEIPIRKTAPDGSLDTSWLARIPADTPFTLQTIDSNGMALDTDESRYQVRPGEVRVDGDPGDTPVHEAATRTPLLTLEEDGSTGATDVPRPLVSVEFFRDVVPILSASCAPCHSGPAPPAGLHLDSGAWQRFPARRDVVRSACGLCHTTTPGRRPLEDEEMRERAYAYQDILGGGKPLYDRLLAPLESGRRYVRPFQARQSYLVWKVFGRRLDGRASEARDDETTFEGGPCPPPEAALSGLVRALTDEDRLKIVRWIDTGAAIQVIGHPPDAEAPGDGPFRDHLPPTLAIDPSPESTHGVPDRLILGLFDADSGIDPESLAVRVAGPGGETLATDLADLDDGRLVIPLPWQGEGKGPLPLPTAGTPLAGQGSCQRPPPLPSGREPLELAIEVADRAGNRTTRELTYRRR